MQVNLPHLSPSRLSTLRQCPARGVHRYTDEWDGDREESGEEAKVGTLVHEACDIWFSVDPRWASGMNEMVRSKQEAGTDRVQAWVESTKELSEKGIVKHPCKSVEHAFNQALDKCVRTNESPWATPLVDSAKEMFVQITAKYDRDTLNILATERTYKGSIGVPGEDGVPVHCRVDLIVDRGDGQIEIIDYKTGHIITPDDEMPDNDQVLCNLLAVRTDPEFSEYKDVSFRFYWVRGDYESTAVRATDEVLRSYTRLLSRIFDYIVNSGEIPEKLNRNCASCPRVRQCNAYAGAMSEVTSESVGIDIDVDQVSDDVLAAEFLKYSAMENACKKAKDTLSKLLFGKASSSAGILECNDHKIRLQQSRTVSYEVDGVLDLCKITGVLPSMVLSAKKNEVERHFGARPELRDQLDNYKSTSKTRPHVRVVRKKKKVNG